MGGGRVWLGGGGFGPGGEEREGCEQRSEAFEKLKKKLFFGGSGEGGSGWGGGGVRVDVNEEVSFCENSKKKNFFFFFVGGGGWAGEGGCQIRGGVGEGVTYSKVWGRWVM